MLRTDEGEVRLLVSEDKWLKTKSMLGELRMLIIQAPEAIPRKRLEQIRGYLVHIAQTYPMLSSYLIGLHMTIAFLRPDRDVEGWRLAPAFVEEMKEKGECSP